MCHSTLVVGFFLVCNVSLYSVNRDLSVMQCVTLQWQCVSLCYSWCLSTVDVGFSLVCNVSLYNGSRFLSGMQCVTLQ